MDLRGEVVVGDALHTQRALSGQIIEAGGDHLWLVKDNQPTLRADIDYLFTASDRTMLGSHLPHDFRCSRQVTKGPGRQEIRTLTAAATCAAIVPGAGIPTGAPASHAPDRQRRNGRLSTA